MKPMSRWLAETVVVSMMAVCSAVYADDEVLVVEPLNTPLVFGALQETFVAPKVKRPETICGNPGGSATNLVDCYELAATYVSYAANGDTIVHLPECNAVSADDLFCDDPANNLCAGNLTLDPLQVKAPVCGELRVDVLPLTTDEPLTFGQQTTGEWDGISTAPPFAVFIATRKGGAVSGNPYRLPIIRIPASALHHLFLDPTTTLSVVSATHTEGNTFQFGYYNTLNRVFTFDQTLGNVANTLIMPIFFGTCC
jgi:hypothetical protein